MRACAVVNEEPKPDDLRACVLPSPVVSSFALCCMSADGEEHARQTERAGVVEECAVLGSWQSNVAAPTAPPGSVPRYFRHQQHVTLCSRYFSSLFSESSSLSALIPRTQ